MSENESYCTNLPKYSPLSIKITYTKEEIENLTSMCGGTGGSGSGELFAIVSDNIPTQNGDSHGFGKGIIVEEIKK